MIELSSIGILSAFLAGAVSFLSPCVLPLVPGYVSFVAGRSLDLAEENAGKRAVLQTFLLGLCFVLGFTTVFTLLGASATALGRVLLSYRFEAGLVGGAIVLLFGLFTTGLIRVPVLERELRYHGLAKGGGPLPAYLLGLAFAFGWTPCIGPVLGSIFTLTAASANTQGMALLAIYSLGLGVPFLIAALFTEQFIVHALRLRRFGRVMHVGAGAIMILMGVAMMTGYITDLATWLLKAFPALGQLG
jgi:cytochrome c-type biogenesis protein